MSNAPLMSGQLGHAAKAGLDDGIFKSPAAPKKTLVEGDIVLNSAYVSLDEVVSAIHRDVSSVGLTGKYVESAYISAGAGVEPIPGAAASSHPWPVEARRIPTEYLPFAEKDKGHILSRKYGGVRPGAWLATVVQLYAYFIMNKSFFSYISSADGFLSVIYPLEVPATVSSMMLNLYLTIEWSKMVDHSKYATGKFMLFMAAFAIALSPPTYSTYEGLQQLPGASDSSEYKVLTGIESALLLLSNAWITLLPTFAMFVENKFSPCIIGGELIPREKWYKSQSDFIKDLLTEHESLVKQSLFNSGKKEIDLKLITYMLNFLMTNLSKGGPSFQGDLRDRLEEDIKELKKEHKSSWPTIISASVLSFSYSYGSLYDTESVAYQIASNLCKAFDGPADSCGFVADPQDRSATL